MSTNTNCLENRACPKCGQSEEMQVVGKVWLDVVDDGSCLTDDKMRGDHEWAERSPARCPKCEFEGHVGDFDTTKHPTHPPKKSP